MLSYVSVADKAVEQLELAFREIDHRAADPRLTRRQIQGEASRLEYAAAATGSAEVGPDAGAELLGRVRLHQVVSGAELEATQLGWKVRAGRDDHDRETGVRSPKPPQEGEAVKGEIQV